MDIVKIPSIINDLKTLQSLASVYYNDPEGAKQLAYGLKAALPFEMREQAKQYYLPLIQNKGTDTLEDRVRAAEQYIERTITALERKRTPVLKMQYKL